MAWDGSKLCEPDEVEKEYGDQSTFLRTNSPDHKQIIADAIATFGEWCSDKLTDILPDIYAQSAPEPSWNLSWDGWLGLQGWNTYDNLDDILDKLVNPNILNLTARVGAKVALIRRQIDQTEEDHTARRENLLVQLKNEEKERDDRFERASRKLKFDLDGDGKISNRERVRTRNSFSRV